MQGYMATKWQAISRSGLGKRAQYQSSYPLIRFLFIWVKATAFYLGKDLQKILHREFGQLLLEIA